MAGGLRFVLEECTRLDPLLRHASLTFDAKRDGEENSEMDRVRAQRRGSTCMCSVCDLVSVQIKCVLSLGGYLQCVNG